jgi:hypothetical protein
MSAPAILCKAKSAILGKPVAGLMQDEGTPLTVVALSALVPLQLGKAKSSTNIFKRSF